MNPLDWTGGPFLMLFGAVSGATLLALWLAPTVLEDRIADESGAGLGAFHLAYLAGGWARAVDTGLVGLLVAGSAVVDTKRGVVAIDGSRAVAPELMPFRDGTAAGITRTEYHKRFRHVTERWRTELVGRGLAPDDERLASLRMIGFGLLCLPMGLGLAKLMVGLSRGRPVGFLVMGLIVTAVVGLMLTLRVPSRNAAGARVLMRQRAKRAARAPLPDELMFAFALGGVGVLKGMEFAGFFRASGSGGDGGGGDGGGGGCGGCSGS